MTITNKHFPKDWQIILIAAALFFLAMQACTTTKQVHQERIKEETQVTVAEETKVVATSETKTDTRTTAETEVKETFDTVIRIWPVVDGKVADKPVDIPIKGERTIYRKEFVTQKQKKQESGTILATHGEMIMANIDHQKFERNVEKVRFPGWFVIIIIGAIIGVVVLIWRLKHS
jgi:hypothetical protein